MKKESKPDNQTSIINFLNNKREKESLSNKTNNLNQNIPPSIIYNNIGLTTIFGQLKNSDPFIENNNFIYLQIIKQNLSFTSPFSSDLYKLANNKYILYILKDSILKSIHFSVGEKKELLNTIQYEYSLDEIDLTIKQNIFERFMIKEKLITFCHNQQHLILLSYYKSIYILKEIKDDKVSLILLTKLNYQDEISSIAINNQGIIVGLSSSFIYLYEFSQLNNDFHFNLNKIINTKNYYISKTITFIFDPFYILSFNDASIALYSIYDENPLFKIKPLESWICKIKHMAKLDIVIILHHNPNKLSFYKFTSSSEPVSRKISLDKINILDFIEYRNNVYFICNEGKIYSLEGYEIINSLKNRRNKFEFDSLLNLKYDIFSSDNCKHTPTRIDEMSIVDKIIKVKCFDRIYLIKLD